MSMGDRKGRPIQTATGMPYWPHDPRPEDISIVDVAHHLSQINRFTGATRRTYSVAEHSVYVSYLCTEAPFAGLMHDATEAYVNDMSKPTKEGLPDYNALEALNWRAMADRFGLPEVLPPCVHIADLQMYWAERKHLMPPCGWHQPPSDLVIPEINHLGMSATDAESAFLRRFHELMPKGH